MKKSTRICNVKDLVHPLPKLLAPVLSNGEKVLICVETTTEVYKNLFGFPQNKYSALVLTNNYICWASKDFTSQDGFMDAMTIYGVSAIKMEATEPENPALEVYGQNGSLFCAHIFSSKTSFNTFIQAMSQVGLSLK